MKIGEHHNCYEIKYNVELQAGEASGWKQGDDQPAPRAETGEVDSGPHVEQWRRAGWQRAPRRIVETGLGRPCVK